MFLCPAIEMTLPPHVQRDVTQRSVTVQDRRLVSPLGQSVLPSILVGHGDFIIHHKNSLSFGTALTQSQVYHRSDDFRHPYPVTFKRDILATYIKGCGDSLAKIISNG